MPTTGDLIYGQHFNNQASSSPSIICQGRDAFDQPINYYYTNMSFGQYGFPGTITAGPCLDRYGDEAHFTLYIYRMNNGTWYLETSKVFFSKIEAIYIPITNHTPDFYKLKITISISGRINSCTPLYDLINIQPFSGQTNSLAWLDNTQYILRQNTMPTYQWFNANPNALPTIQSEQYDTPITYQQFGGYYWA